MVREFTRNMFIMLVAIMVGAVIITFFVGDIVNRSQIDSINSQHSIEMTDLNSKNENFTDYMLQGSITLDAARETREVANYYFDFALYWFNLGLNTKNISNARQSMVNCSFAQGQYREAMAGFEHAPPYFLTARNYTNTSKYLEVIGYYIGFAHAGRNITQLRYNASLLLYSAAENLSLGNMQNVTDLMENFSAVEEQVGGAMQDYEGYRQQIDGYLFFSEIREIPDPIG
jgi:hypothetical protein